MKIPSPFHRNHAAATASREPDVGEGPEVLGVSSTAHNFRLPYSSSRSVPVPDGSLHTAR